MLSENELYQYLNQHQIAYQRIEHPPVYTVEQANRYLLNQPGERTKNLFICDEKKQRYFILLVPSDKQVNFNPIGRALGLGKVRFGSPEKLKEMLGLEPGSVTVLSLVNDTRKQVTLLADRVLWSCDAFQCHPLVNTSTLVISRADIERFFELTGHPPRMIDVPEKPPAVDTGSIE